MSGAEQLQEANISRYNNSAYTVPTIVGKRLDTTELMNKIERFLKGQRPGHQKLEDGSVVPVIIQECEPLANEKGINHILRRIESIINSQTVQGNFNLDGLNNYLYDVEWSLGKMIAVHDKDWDIETRDQDMIVDSIMDTVVPFMTRTLDNKERESYTQTMSHKESSSVSEKPGGLGGFFGR